MPTTLHSGSGRLYAQRGSSCRLFAFHETSASAATDAQDWQTVILSTVGSLSDSSLPCCLACLHSFAVPCIAASETATGSVGSVALPYRWLTCVAYSSPSTWMLDCHSYLSGWWRRFLNQLTYSILCCLFATRESTDYHRACSVSLSHTSRHVQPVHSTIWYFAEVGATTCAVSDHWYALFA